MAQGFPSSFAAHNSVEVVALPGLPVAIEALSCMCLVLALICNALKAPYILRRLVCWGRWAVFLYA